MKKTGATVALLTVMGAAYVAGGPFITMHGIRSAIQQQDSEMLSEYVDFPVLRANLKDQFNAQFTKEIAATTKDNPFAALGMMFASKMIDGMMDSMVTPTGIANLAAGRKPAHPMDASKSEPGASQTEPFKNARYAYDSLSRFSVWVKSDDGSETRMVLARQGFSWKLNNIIVPDNLFAGGSSARTGADAGTAAKLGGLFGAGKETPGIPDGTQDAAMKLMRDAVTVTLVSKKLNTETGYSGIVMDEKLDVKFGYKNNTGKDIAGVKGYISIKDLFGDEISGFEISNDTTIRAGQTVTWTGSRSVRFSLGDNKDRKLAELGDDKFKTVWEPEMIVFKDGTQMTREGLKPASAPSSAESPPPASGTSDAAQPESSAFSSTESRSPASRKNGAARPKTKLASAPDAGEQVGKENDNKKKQEQKELEDQLSQQVNQEEGQRNSEARATAQQVWFAQIQEKVKRNWLQPSGAPDDFKCQLRVQLLPGGQVVGVTLASSCGNSILDDSVKRAVLKSDPLPPPQDPSVFDREINFDFIPYP